MKINYNGLWNPEEENSVSKKVENTNVTEEEKRRIEKAEIIKENFSKFQAFIKNKGNQKVAISKAQIIFTPNERHKIITHFTEEMQSYTNGKEVWVSLFEEALLKDDEGLWLIELIAHTFHEYCHIMYTDFNDMEKIMEYSKIVFAKNSLLRPDTAASIGAILLNGMIEDPAVEQAGVIEFPGMYPYLWFKNKIIYDQIVITEEAKDNNKIYDDFINVLLCYGKFGEFPLGYLESYSNTELSEYVDKAISIIDTAIDERTSREREKICEELIDILCPFIERLLKDDGKKMNVIEKYLENQEYAGCASQKTTPSPRSQGEKEHNLRGSKRERKQRCSKENQNDSESTNVSGVQNSECNNGSQSHESSGNDSHSSIKSSTDSTFQKQGKVKNEDEAYCRTKENSSDEDEKNNHDSENENRYRSNSSRFSREELENLSKLAFEESEREMLNEKSNNDEKSREREISEQNNIGSEIENWKEAIYGRSYNTFSEKIISENIRPYKTSIPLDLQTEATKMKKVMRKFLTDDSENLYNLRSGKLNKKGLTKTAVSDNVFYRSGSKGLSDSVIYLLIDNSGSMRGKKCYEARNAAAVIEESLMKIIPMRIALFNEFSGEVNHFVIRDFDDKRNMNYSYSSLFYIDADGCNADSINILVAALELKKRKENRKFLFILSDGVPASYGSRFSAIKEVNVSVKEARKAGVEVISIMFGDEAFRNANYETYKKMYEKNILSCDPQSITEKLPKILARVVLS